MDNQTGERNHAYHGSDWPEHEDFLIGNKAGLERLQTAIGETLERGESTLDSGEFLGVRCLDDAFFEQRESNDSGFSVVFAWVMIGAVVVVFLLGLKGLVSWWSGAC